MNRMATSIEGTRAERSLDHPMHGSYSAAMRRLGGAPPASHQAVHRSGDGGKGRRSLAGFLSSLTGSDTRPPRYHLAVTAPGTCSVDAAGAGFRQASLFGLCKPQLARPSPRVVNRYRCSVRLRDRHLRALLRAGGGRSLIQAGDRNRRGLQLLRCKP